MKVGDLVKNKDSQAVGLVLKSSSYYPDDSDLRIPLVLVVWPDGKMWVETNDVELVEERNEQV
ncbi:hypothetical protein OAA09_01170 [bacterium]|nr:hypothetical protein [bacterium]